MAEDKERMVKVAKALQSDAMKSQITEWKNQREFLRLSIVELWDGGVNFKYWWTNVAEEVRQALVMTALEDLPTSSPLSPVLLGITCPDLLSEEIFKPERFIAILEALVSQKENEGDLLSLATVTKNLNFDNAEKQDNLLQDLPSAAKNTLNLARSCLLLQFSLAILLVYCNEKDEFEIDPPKDNEEDPKK